MTTMTKKHGNPNCSHPGCTAPGLLRVEEDTWLCVAHAHQRINSPENMALTEADADMQEFTDEGGKLS
jgi:hypothetical protein